MPENTKIVENTIIVKVFNSKYSVTYGTVVPLEKASEKCSTKTLYNRGNEFTLWSDQAWENIIRNLQIDATRNPCRFVVFSDVSVKLPKDDFLTVKWTWEDLSAARCISNVHAGKWIVNGTGLSALDCPKCFPVEKGAELVYITTFPEFVVSTKQEMGRTGESDLYKCFRKKAEGN